MISLARMLQNLVQNYRHLKPLHLTNDSPKLKRRCQEMSRLLVSWYVLSTDTYTTEHLLFTTMATVFQMASSQVKNFVAHRHLLMATNMFRLGRHRNFPDQCYLHCTSNRYSNYECTTHTSGSNKNETENYLSKM